MIYKSATAKRTNQQSSCSGLSLIHDAHPNHPLSRSRDIDGIEFTVYMNPVIESVFIPSLLHVSASILRGFSVQFVELSS
jgi:hypothetical protein